MRRKYNRRIAMEGIERLRRAFPRVQFTTDMIVGFPGESDADFAESVAFIKEAELLMVHVFPYSARQGTPAAEMKEQVPEQIKHLRVAAMNEAAKEVRQKILRASVGQTVPVLFETYKSGVAYGHTDSFIEVACPCASPLASELCSVLLTDADDTRCYGEIRCRL